METQIYRQGTPLRCYKCGSPDVAAICHHCGRPMCSRHGPIYPLLRWFMENREYTNLNLGAWPLNRDNGAHCEYHVHSSLNFRLVMVLPGLAILALGTLLLISALFPLGTCLLNRPSAFEPGPAALAEGLRDPGIYSGVPISRCYIPQLTRDLLWFGQALLVVLCGVGVVAAGSRFNQENINAEITGLQTELPVGLVSEGIEAVETMRVQADLDEAGLAHTRLLGEIRGEIRPEFRFTANDIRRLREYRRKYKVKDRDLPFQAGYLAFEGEPLIELEPADAEAVTHLRTIQPRYRPERQNFFWLEGMMGNYAYLSGGRRADAAWPKAWHYTVPVGPQREQARPYLRRDDGFSGWGEVPVRIIPLLYQVGNARSLYLDLHFNPRLFPFLEPTPERAHQIKLEEFLVLEQLQLLIDPFLLGRPQASGLVSEVAHPQEGAAHPMYLVEWRNIVATVDEQVQRIPLPRIQFDQAIPEGAHLTGSLRLRVPALRSGIRRVRYFSPLGHPVSNKNRSSEPFPFRATTYLQISFDLALAGLPLSTVSTLDGRPLEAVGAPTPRRLRRLLDALNTNPTTGGPADNVYVRRVVESTPQVGEQSLEAGRWHWDISGRHYRGTYPVDFHVVVYGHGDSRQGLTRVDTSVQGQIYESNPGAPDPYETSRRHLAHTRDEISDILQRALQASEQEEAQS